MTGTLSVNGKRTELTGAALMLALFPPVPPKVKLYVPKGSKPAKSRRRF